MLRAEEEGLRGLKSDRLGELKLGVLRDDELGDLKLGMLLRGTLRDMLGGLDERDGGLNDREGALYDRDGLGEDRGADDRELPIDRGALTDLPEEPPELRRSAAPATSGPAKKAKATRKRIGVVFMFRVFIGSPRVVASFRQSGGVRAVGGRNRTPRSHLKQDPERTCRKPCRCPLRTWEVPGSNCRVCGAARHFKH